MIILITVINIIIVVNIIINNIITNSIKYRVLITIIYYQQYN